MASKGGSKAAFFAYIETEYMSNLLQGKGKTAKNGGEIAASGYVYWATAWRIVEFAASEITYDRAARLGGTWKLSRAVTITL